MKKLGLILIVLLLTSCVKIINTDYLYTTFYTIKGSKDTLKVNSYTALTLWSYKGKQYKLIDNNRHVFAKSNRYIYIVKKEIKELKYK